MYEDVKVDVSTCEMIDIHTEIRSVNQSAILSDALAQAVKSHDWNFTKENTKKMNKCPTKQLVFKLSIFIRIWLWSFWEVVEINFYRVCVLLRIAL